MTAHNKQALREHYSPKPVPKCHICGAEMTIQRMSVLRTTYGCTGATYDDKGCHYAEGRSIADDHYAQSHVTVVDLSDPEVLAVLDELEATESKCRELAAENAGLKSAKSVVVKVAGNLTRGNYFDELQTKMNRHASVQTTTVIAFMDEARETMKQHAGKLIGSHNFETPVTDAFLAEVRASGIDEMAVEYRKFANKDGCSCNMQSSYNLTAERAESYAAYIRRQGGKS